LAGNVGSFLRAIIVGPCVAVSPIPERKAPMRRKLLISVLFGSVIGIAFIMIGTVGLCADFPQKPIKIVAPAEPGGAEDTHARTIAPFLQQYLGITVQVENQAGAGGKIGLERFQNTTPDGCTIICNSLPKSVIYEYMYKVGFRTKEFSPIFAWAVSYNTVVVNSESWKTFDEFLKAAKEKTLAGALSAIGGTTHLGSLAATKELGIKANWVPFDGVNGSLAALAGKHVDFSILTASSAVPLIRAGKLRPLIMFSDTRDTSFPDVPTAKELGYKIPSVVTVYGLQAPPNTPAAVVKVLEEACAKAVKEPAFVEWANKRQLTLKPLTSVEYKEYIVNEAYPTVETYQGLMKEGHSPL
jgi:tripartite-type tricarboxylate transporter receptor subunit TctC